MKTRTRTRTDQRYKRDERAVDEHLAQIASHPSRGPWLPMPVMSTARLTRAEVYEFRRRHALHEAEYPGYEAGFHRPSAACANDVWRHLGLSDVDTYLGSIVRTGDEIDTSRIVVM